MKAIERPPLKRRVEHTAYATACLDLSCVKWAMVKEELRPPGVAVLLKEAEIIVRGGELLIAAARVGSDPLAGPRPHEVMQSYFSRKEPCIRSGGSDSLLVVDGPAREAALKVGKKLEKEAKEKSEKEAEKEKKAAEPVVRSGNNGGFQQHNSGQNSGYNGQAQKRFHGSH